MRVNFLGCASMAVVAPLFISGLLVGTAYGNGITPYKVEMDRITPNKPIRKSAIMSKVRKTFPGTNLWGKTANLESSMLPVRKNKSTCQPTQSQDIPPSSINIYPTINMFRHHERPFFTI